MISEQSAIPLAGVFILLAAYVAHSKLTNSKDIWSQLPWVGRRDGFFWDIRARLDSLRSNALEISDAGYKKFSQSGSAFILPGFDAHSVIVPASEINWLINQPDSVMSAAAMQRETIQTDWSLLDADIARHDFQGTTIRRDLTRAIGGLVPEIEEELNLGADIYWGTDNDEWREVCVFDSVQQIVTRTSNRVFVGLPLCRNDDFIANSINYVQDVALSGSLIKLIPNLIKPLTAWIFQLPTRWHFHHINKYLLPEVKKRLSLAQKTVGDTKDALPNDFLTWYMLEALNNPLAKERGAYMISKRVMATNFAAIHTSSFTATNLLLDLYSSPRAEEFVAALRTEVATVLAAHNNIWTKAALAQLVRIDSALRESMRISTFQSQGLYRLVVDPNGATMDNGLHLPQGTRVGTSVYSIHHDEGIYEDAGTYDALRFSRAREESSDVLKAKNLAAVTTSDTFLSFGHGRHACPGRFFATTEMKLLLAYIVMNYDVQPLKERPQSTIMAGFRMPPTKATLSVRRRKLT